MSLTPIVLASFGNEETTDGETFQERREQFEAVAQLANGHFPLVFCSDVIINRTIMEPWAQKFAMDILSEE